MLCCTFPHNDRSSAASMDDCEMCRLLSCTPLLGTVSTAAAFRGSFRWLDNNFWNWFIVRTCFLSELVRSFGCEGLLKKQRMADSAGVLV